MAFDEIVEGGVYAYMCGIPRGVYGEKYRVVKNHVLDVPSYQYKVMVEALTGRDKGKVFVCTPANFVHRYKPVDGEVMLPLPPKHVIAGFAGRIVMQLFRARTIMGHKEKMPVTKMTIGPHGLAILAQYLVTVPEEMVAKGEKLPDQPVVMIDGVPLFVDATMTLEDGVRFAV